MSKHFSYLFEDPGREFFAKAACEAAERVYGISAADKSTVEKTASAQERTTFEKVASRLDRDIQIIKTAGACGVNVGMGVRSAAYVDGFLLQQDLTVEEFADCFDKVAAAAIEIDLSAAKHQLYKLAGDDADLRAAVDEEIVFLGYNMSKLAMLEKEALIGSAARALLAAGAAGAKAIGKKGLSATGRAIKAVPGAAKKVVTAPFRGAAAAGRGAASAYRGARLGMAKRNLQGIASRLRSPLATKGSAGGKAYRESLKASRAKQQKSLQGLLKDPKYRAEWKKRTPAGKARSQAEASLKEQRKVKTIKGEAGREQAERAASDAARNNTIVGTAPPPNAPKPPTTETPSGPKPPGFFESAKKLRAAGYSPGSLSPAERGALIEGLGKGALGYRVMMGEGAVTGGEGLV